MKKIKLDSLPLEQKDKIIEERRVKERERKASYSKSLKTLETTSDTQHSPSLNAYSSKASFGKAIARVKRNLPGSPRKKRAVIKHLAFEEEKKQKFCNRKSSTPGRTALPDSIKTAVIQYYQRDEISRQAPGKRDTTTVRENGAKHTYKNEKSKFAALRPPHVLLTSELPINVCVCRYHENFILLWDALDKFNVRFPLYHHELASSLICAECSDNCWYNKCEIYKDGVLFKEKYPPTLDLDSDQETYLDGKLKEENFIRRFQWEKIVGLNGKERMEKIHKTGLPSELYISLFEMLPTVNWHHFIKGKQAAHYNT
ncbi:hypothetical protein LOD99_5673 [Oopsacas minuta]|uniref:Uncharacterized protein n=1 Tax=Oopsacas minuta TaxID=111878 RepID=A0AAV7JQH2_9METZ|nr:hypothetical protein LOD99_5673 [Oopsacas minuta]